MKIQKNSLNSISYPYLIASIFAFLLFGANIFSSEVSLVDKSGDAYSIWMTIVSLHSEKIESSYVLYKGFLSVYPFVYLYKLSLFMGLEKFIFIKIYFATLFSITSGLLIPYVVSNILNIKISVVKNLVFVLLLFYSVQFTLIFHALMVDLPSWAFFTAAIAVIIKYTKNFNNYYLFIGGVCIGLGLCSSGQYSLSSYILIAYCLFIVIKNSNKKKARLLFSLLILFSSVVTPKLWDLNFHRSVVKPLKISGEWIPTSEEWLHSGIKRLLPRYRFDDTNNRGMALLKSTEGANFDVEYQKIKNGGGSYSTNEYIKILSLYPLDFVVMWITKIFISISFDGGYPSVLHLLISYTATFFCLYLLYLNVKTIKDLLIWKTVILLSIFSTAIGSMVLIVEMRHVVTLFSFIIAFAVFQNEINLTTLLSNKIAFLKMKTQISYLFVAYILFIAFCFCFYGSLQELYGPYPEKILFKW
jgi:hypothetical protein